MIEPTLRSASAMHAFEQASLRREKNACVRAFGHQGTHIIFGDCCLRSR